MADFEGTTACKAEEGTRMVRAGFIGAGTMASAHLAALRLLPDVQITAFADPVAERAQERAGQFGGAAVAHVEGLWEHVDAVWVCSPPDRHAEDAVAAARAGRHVFVERPMAHTTEAAEQIVQACREANVRLMVGHVLRFWPSLQRLRQLLVDGDLGRLITCSSRRFADAVPAELPAWRRDWRRGGGFTIEWGSPEVDFVRWAAEPLAGPVERVHGRVVCSRPDFPDFDDFARATLTFGSGAV